jgi:hypothetical protein
MIIPLAFPSQQKDTSALLPYNISSRCNPSNTDTIHEELFLEFIRADIGLNNLSVGLGGFLVTSALIRTLASSMSCAEPVAPNALANNNDSDAGSYR